MSEGGFLTICNRKLFSSETLFEMVRKKTIVQCTGLHVSPSQNVKWSQMDYWSTLIDRHFCQECN